MKKIAIALMCAIMILPSCGNMNNTGKGAIVGTGAGATIGAIIGALISKDGKGAAIGAAAGAALGGGSGALIGHAMDKKAKELAELEGTNVEVIDINGFKGIKVTFKDGSETMEGKYISSEKIITLTEPNSGVTLYFQKK